MVRFIRYLTRPTILASERERAAAGIPALHEHPPWMTLPINSKFLILFAHPFYHGGYVRSFVYWEQRGLGWWMDIPLERSRRLPRITVPVGAYRL